MTCDAFGQGALDSVDVALDPSEMEGLDEQALKDKYDDHVKEQRKANSSSLPDDSYEEEKKSKKKKQKVSVVVFVFLCLVRFVCVQRVLAATCSCAFLTSTDTRISRTARKIKTSVSDFCRYACAMLLLPCVNLFQMTRAFPCIKCNGAPVVAYVALCLPAACDWACDPGPA